jgi:hypothetical protein
VAEAKDETRRAARHDDTRCLFPTREDKYTKKKKKKKTNNASNSSERGAAAAKAEETRGKTERERVVALCQEGMYPQPLTPRQRRTNKFGKIK